MMIRAVMRDRHEAEMGFWWGSLGAIVWTLLGWMLSLVYLHHTRVCSILFLPTSYHHQGTMGGLSLSTGDCCPGPHKRDTT